MEEQTNRQADLEIRIEELELKIEDLEQLNAAYEHQIETFELMLLEIGIRSQNKQLEEFAAARLGDKRTIVHKMSLGFKLSKAEKEKIIEILGNEQ